MNISDWFQKRSFHHDDFASIGAMHGSRIGLTTATLVLPGRNVASTIGTILDTVHRLNERSGLLCQIIVVDADSPDGTADVARRHGAEVYSENELMPEYGPCQGKGDAMWRSLSVARGDVIMFADTDTTDFEEHFVYGTLGPLLADPGIRFTKAAFRRPFAAGSSSVADGGGRVTELMAKPLINLLYPELAGFVQPLAGEFAGTAELFRSVPFFTGYGVEIGLMIDVSAVAGLDAMAQVDLGTRQNRHQPLHDLTRMASVILRATAFRTGLPVEVQHRTETYLHAVATEHGLRLDEHYSALTERPPIVACYS
jgi:glucosyl-3-phosphoglycerate synthase